MGNEAGKLGNRQEFCCLQSQVVICAGMIDDSGDMDIAGSRKLVADPNAGTEASGSKCYKADMFWYAEGGVDRNNKRIRITVVYGGQCIRQITGMDGVTETSIYGRFFCTVGKGQRSDQLMPYQRTKTVPCCAV